MRIFLSCAAVVLMSLMLAEPLLASEHGMAVGASDVSLVVLGLTGVLLGRRAGMRVAD